MSYYSGKLRPNVMSSMSEGTAVAVIIAHKNMDNPREKDEDKQKTPIYLRPVPEYLLNLEKISPNASIAERMELIGSEWADRIRTVFPELAELEHAEAEGQNFWASRIRKQQTETPSLPKEAPALWDKDKQPGDTPPDFIKRHYAPWLGKGLARNNLGHLDPKLYTALTNWLRKNNLPEDFDLPNKSESWSADPMGDTPPEVREARRIVSRWDKRQARARMRAEAALRS